jgi:hypothetical protein
MRFSKGIPPRYMVCLRKATGNSSVFDQIHSHSFLNTGSLFEVASHLMPLPGS